MLNYDHTINKTNVLIIGCGGAGLRAAIEIKKNGIDVIILGKRPRNDAHTVLAAGGINAAFGNLDTQDSWKQHFVDTYLEGYEIGDPEQIELMAKESPALVKEIDDWGANFAKLKNGKFDQRFFGAHKYRRTCYSGDYTGFSILKTLLNKAEFLKIPIYDFQYVSDLLIKSDSCFGAISFNIVSGERTIHYADSVIICTGGHTRLWEKSSSRKNENTGDGYHLGLKAGCNLIDMEMVQFHPSGMVSPEEMVGTLVTEAVRGEGGKLYNNKGERFMVNYDKDRMELSTRDRIAVANYKEISEGRGTKNGGVYLDISHKEKSFILKKIPKIYKQFMDSQRLDISKKPMEVAPTAHYSMGGILVNAKDHNTNIRGLFAAGEVAGGLHGANRLGGNSLAEILVFGRRAGIASINYSKNLSSQIISQSIVKEAHENLNKFFTNGKEDIIPIQNNLRNIMWDYCGVVKNKELLSIGIKKIKDLKNQLKNLKLSARENNFSDLSNALDLESSLITAEATIISALERKETRGAHQRSDFPFLEKNENYNLSIKQNKSNGELKIKKINSKILSADLKKILKNNLKDDELKNKLLE